MQRYFLTSLFLVALFATSAQAAITIEIQDASVLQGTPGATLDVVISSDAGDEPIAITGDFQILNAAFLDPPAAFDQPGFFNEGNYNAASSIVADPNDPSLAFMSLDIETAAAIPNTNVVLAQLFVDSINLAPGVYDVQLSNVFVFDAQGQVDAVGVDGALTVTAIPEPTGAIVLGAIAAFIGVRRRRR
ncbi:MAG: PEP-CTERM sorting domain-containing protein [Planctomycetota bacterium]